MRRTACTDTSGTSTGPAHRSGRHHRKPAQAARRHAVHRRAVRLHPAQVRRLDKGTRGHDAPRKGHTLTPDIPGLIYDTLYVLLYGDAIPGHEHIPVILPEPAPLISHYSGMMISGCRTRATAPSCTFGTPCCCRSCTRRGEPPRPTSTGTGQKKRTGPWC